MPPRRERTDALPDARERAIAATEFGRTVVVTAGAGTGKTALLVERTLRILMQPARPVPVTDVLALTFSNRAAGEMRVRIREALVSFVEWSSATGGPPPSAGHLGEVYRGTVSPPGGRGGISRGEVRERSAQALASLERASISTMHSFAAEMLRRNPVEAGVDPYFREDDGLTFAERFEAEWERFLEAELGPSAPRAGLWNAVLDSVSLADLTGLARRLSDEEVPLDALAAGRADGSLFEHDAAWIEGLAREARELSSAHPKTAAQKIGRAVDAAAGVFEGVLEGEGPEGLARYSPDLAGTRVDSKKWDRRDVARARALTEIAARLASARPDAIRGALDLVLDFARNFRADFVRGGSMSFSALLVRARDLLRDHPAVREDLKRRYGHVLVDEFQDTDPVQYEIVFYLAEREGVWAREWRDCELEPGKLFIVGDPKQSIYHFRGADIGAYHQVVGERLAGEAVSASLRTNFRSNERLISAVNGVFGAVIREERGVQPAYEPLAARPGGEAVLPSQRVDFLIVRPPGRDDDAFRYSEDGHEGEARAVARFIAGELVGEMDIPDGKGGVRAARAGDVAVLLRKMTTVGFYTRALDAEGVPYTVEGEKSFYATQEVTDFLNLLSALSDPHDETALVGVLRSGTGALTDADVAGLARAGRLGYLADAPLPDGLDDREGVAALFSTLRELHSSMARLPSARAIDLLVDRLPVVEAAVASGSGERGRANLLKIRRMAAQYGARPEMTMREFVSVLRGRVAELREEGESPLAEEDADAVRVLTIHKAKGLEFPIVVMPGLHAGGRSSEERVWVRTDWRTGGVGLRVGSAWTSAAVRLDAREKEIAEAEERRVFYVGATRARERLVLSAARLERTPAGILSYLAEAVSLPLDSHGTEVVGCGEGEIHFTSVEAPAAGGARAAGRGRRELPTEEIKLCKGRWRRRRERHKQALARRVLVSPSALAGGDDARLEAEVERMLDAGAAPWEARGQVGHSGGPTRAGAVGSVVHRALELLDFETTDADPEIDRLTGLAAERLNLDPRTGRKEIADEAASILRDFVRSEAFAELRRAKVLAKELSCMLPWDVEAPEAGGRYRAACSARMDLLCELGGRLLVVDYKTSRVEPAEAATKAGEFREQGLVYARAVSLAFGRRVHRFRVVFLRPCVSVDVHIDGTE